MKFDKYDNDSLINFYIENGLEFDERKKYFGNNIRSFALLENENIIGAVSISIHAPPRGATAKDMQFLQIFCSTLTNQHGLTIVPRNLSRLFW